MKILDSTSDKFQVFVVDNPGAQVLLPVMIPVVNSESLEVAPGYVMFVGNDLVIGGSTEDLEVLVPRTSGNVTLDILKPGESMIYVAMFPDPEQQWWKGFSTTDLRARMEQAEDDVDGLETEVDILNDYVDILRRPYDATGDSGTIAGPAGSITFDNDTPYDFVVTNNGAGGFIQLPDISTAPTGDQVPVGWAVSITNDATSTEPLAVYNFTGAPTELWTLAIGETRIFTAAKDDVNDEWTIDAAMAELEGDVGDLNDTVYGPGGTKATPTGGMLEDLYGEDGDGGGLIDDVGTALSGGVVAGTPIRLSEEDTVTYTGVAAALDATAPYYQTVTAYTADTTVTLPTIVAGTPEDDSEIQEGWALLVSSLSTSQFTVNYQAPGDVDIQAVAPGESWILIASGVPTTWVAVSTTDNKALIAENTAVLEAARVEDRIARKEGLRNDPYFYVKQHEGMDLYGGSMTLTALGMLPATTSLTPDGAIFYNYISGNGYSLGLSGGKIVVGIGDGAQELKAYSDDIAGYITGGKLFNLYAVCIRGDTAIAINFYINGGIVGSDSVAIPSSFDILAGTTLTVANPDCWLTESQYFMYPGTFSGFYIDQIDKDPRRSKLNAKVTSVSGSGIVQENRFDYEPVILSGTGDTAILSTNTIGADTHIIKGDLNTDAASYSHLSGRKTVGESTRLAKASDTGWASDHMFLPGQWGSGFIIVEVAADGEPSNSHAQETAANYSTHLDVVVDTGVVYVFSAQYAHGLEVWKYDSEAAYTTADTVAGERAELMASDTFVLQVNGITAVRSPYRPNEVLIFLGDAGAVTVVYLYKITEETLEVITLPADIVGDDSSTELGGTVTTGGVASGTLTGSGTDFVNDLKVGDALRLTEDIGDGFQYTYVQQINSANEILVVPDVTSSPNTYRLYHRGSRWGMQSEYYDLHAYHPTKHLNKGLVMFAAYHLEDHHHGAPYLLIDWTQTGSDMIVTGGHPFILDNSPLVYQGKGVGDFTIIPHANADTDPYLVTWSGESGVWRYDESVLSLQTNPEIQCYRLNVEDGTFRASDAGTSVTVPGSHGLVRLINDGVSAIWGTSPARGIFRVDLNTTTRDLTLQTDTYNPYGGNQHFLLQENDDGEDIIFAGGHGEGLNILLNTTTVSSEHQWVRYLPPADRHAMGKNCHSIALDTANGVVGLGWGTGGVELRKYEISNLKPTTLETYTGVAATTTKTFVTNDPHGLITTDTIFCTAGTYQERLPDGAYPVTVTDPNTFTVEGLAEGTGGGGRSWIRKTTGEYSMIGDGEVAAETPLIPFTTSEIPRAGLVFFNGYFVAVTEKGVATYLATDNSPWDFAEVDTEAWPFEVAPGDFSLVAAPTINNESGFDEDTMLVGTGVGIRKFEVADTGVITIDPDVYDPTRAYSALAVAQGTAGSGDTFNVGNPIATGITTDIIEGAGRYPDGIYNPVSMTGGSGSGMVAAVVVTDGHIVSVNITDIGAGYTPDEYIEIQPLPTDYIYAFGAPRVGRERAFTEKALSVNTAREFNTQDTTLWVSFEHATPHNLEVGDIIEISASTNTGVLPNQLETVGAITSTTMFQIGGDTLGEVLGETCTWTYIAKAKKFTDVNYPHGHNQGDVIGVSNTDGDKLINGTGYEVDILAGHLGTFNHTAETVSTGGEFYPEDGLYEDVALRDTDGTGTGMIVDVTVTSNAVTAVSVTDHGNGYNSGEVVKVPPLPSAISFKIPGGSEYDNSDGGIATWYKLAVGTTTKEDGILIKVDAHDFGGEIITETPNVQYALSAHVQDNITLRLCAYMKSEGLRLYDEYDIYPDGSLGLVGTVQAARYSTYLQITDAYMYTTSYEYYGFWTTSLKGIALDFTTPGPEKLDTKGGEHHGYTRYLTKLLEPRPPSYDLHFKESHVIADSWSGSLQAHNFKVLGEGTEALIEVYAQTTVDCLLKVGYQYDAGYYYPETLLTSAAGWTRLSLSTEAAHTNKTVYLGAKDNGGSYFTGTLRVVIHVVRLR